MFLRRAIGMRLNGVLPSCVAFRPSGVLGVLLLCVLVALTGCSSKNISSKGPFVLQEPSKGYPSVPSSSGQKTGTVYLPSDDGRPLTKAEQEAFLSEGEIDRNLPQGQTFARYGSHPRPVPYRQSPFYACGCPEPRSALPRRASRGRRPAFRGRFHRVRRSAHGRYGRSPAAHPCA